MVIEANERETEVIIPTYNGEKFIGELLLSLASQDRDDFLVTVSDNGSSDSTMEIASNFEDVLSIRCLDASGKRGKPYALNHAIKSKTGSDKLLFIDQDDTVNKEYVRRMSEALDSRPFVASYMDSCLLNQECEQRVAPRFAPHDQKYGQFEINIAAGGTLGLRRSTLEEIGLFDEGFNFSTNDVEFCYRAHSTGYELQLVEGAILNYRFRKGIKANFDQGAYYGKGNYAIAQRHPEIRGDQKSSLLLAFNSLKRLMPLLVDKTSRELQGHEIGKNIGQLTSRLKVR